ncbi:hypothetical protein [Flavobacterium hibernum]|uniref:Lipocalin-like domain-containing protein n=1 Tax=Flavobacterium hibernum TaxID=37752 RepID=A0A0D0EF66_9FLAO|nr:hypothetical protein [Flavobacterium hibernum]KIO53569.1 hypothetical protein IW18_07160 [Flavobacterium hibernum]OXA84422.1 hypothetical protein B0A73_19700 [Flavobacterium hibernum]PTT03528.1 hypothetical protein DBR27_10320 [Flavobacterium sp. HMWF030]STO10168.1 Uncharacterised protein [Flavobacterium hibernum]
MKKLFLFSIVCCLFSTAYSIESTTMNSGSIVNTWIWEKSIGGNSNPYTATPQTIGFNKKVVFTNNGRVITYKNNVEIRNSIYTIEKGIGFFDQLEHDLITFEGKTYVIENIDNQNLTIVSNNEDASRTIYKR